jgi:hypothetical protein
VLLPVKQREHGRLLESGLWPNNELSLKENIMRKLIKTAVLAVALTAAVPAFAAEPAYSTASTDIGTLLDNPETKAVLEKHIPEVISNAQFEMARPMTLRAIQAYAAEALTDEKLAAIDADLAKIAAKEEKKS